MPGPEEIPDVPAFVVLRLVVGRWSFGGWSLGELNSEASLQRISLEGGAPVRLSGVDRRDG
jgi:hypothetical protein